jgi:hypothetical protein
MLFGLRNELVVGVCFVAEEKMPSEDQHKSNAEATIRGASA